MAVIRKDGIAIRIPSSWVLVEAAAARLGFAGLGARDREEGRRAVMALRLKSFDCFAGVELGGCIGEMVGFLLRSSRDVGWVGEGRVRAAMVV